MKDIRNKKLPLEKIIASAKATKAKKMILFGSSVNLEKPHDLDLCIVVDNDKNILEFQKQFRLKLWDLKYDWKLPLDLHVYQENIYQKRLSQNDFFITEVAKGVTLYG